MRLQKQMSRKVGNIEYTKWVVVIPPEIVKESGLKEGEELIARVKEKKIVIEPKT